MEKYRLDLTYTKSGASRRLIIKADATDDEEALRTSHALIDLAFFEGAKAIVVEVTGASDRAVATIRENEDDSSFLDRPVQYGSGYRSDSNRS